MLYYAFDFWTNPNSFDDFENNVRAYMVTRGVDVVKHLSEFTINPGLGFDTYAAQMQAIFSPDTTGEFEFWVIGGDYAMLFIGDDEQSTSRQLVAQLNGYTLSRSTYVIVLWKLLEINVIMFPASFSVNIYYGNKF